MSSRRSQVTRLTASVIAILMLTVVLGYWGMRALGTLKTVFADSVTRSAKIKLASRIDAVVSNMLAYQRAMLQDAVAHNRAAVERDRLLFLENVKEVEKSLDDLRPRLVSAEDRWLHKNMSEALAQWVIAFGELNPLLAAENLEEAVKFASRTMVPLYAAIGSDADRLTSQSLSEHRNAVTNREQ
jgi:hypothetical protein